MMNCKHIIGKVLETKKEEYHYICIKCGHKFGKEQIDGYLVKNDNEERKNFKKGFKARKF